MSANGSRSAVAPNRLGLVLAPPTAAQRRDQGLSEGLVVQRSQGAAARAEVRQGDVVLAAVVSGRQVRLNSVADFDRFVGGLEAGQQVTLLVRRGEATSYVSLRAGK